MNSRSKIWRAPKRSCRRSEHRESNFTRALKPPAAVAPAADANRPPRPNRSERRVRSPTSSRHTGSGLGHWTACRRGCPAPWPAFLTDSASSRFSKQPIQQAADSASSRLSKAQCSMASRTNRSSSVSWRGTTSATLTFSAMAFCSKRLSLCSPSTSITKRLRTRLADSCSPAQ